MEGQEGFSRISAFIAIIAVVLVLGGAGYLGLRKEADLDDKEDTFFEGLLGNKIDNSTPIKLEPRTVAFADGTVKTSSLASEFDLAVAAEDLGKALKQASMLRLSH